MNANVKLHLLISTSSNTRLVPRAAPITEKLEILSPPRELNPSLMAWKGASVTAKLDLTKELWIYQKEWAELGVRCLREKALFVW
jgi:actin-related protein 8